MQTDINKYKLIELSKPVKVNDFSAPVKYLPSPMLTEYNKGVITRYFAIKVNDKILIEINKNQFDLLSSKSKSGIDYNLYEPLSFKWRISGQRKDFYSNSIITVYGAEDTNNRTIERLAKQYPFIKDYFKNKLEFYIDIN